MNKEQFTKKLVELIQSRLDESYSVEQHYVTKNNDVRLLAITIRAKEQTVCPTIYIDDYYDDFCNGMDIFIIAKKVIDTYHRHSFENEYDYVGNLPNMKDKILCKLVNTESNKSALQNCPHREFLDLSVLYYVYYGKDELGNHQTLTITYDILEYIGLSTDELDEVAITNMQKHSKPYIESMVSVMLKATGIANCPETGAFSEVVSNMYIISNESIFYGAAVILQKDVLKDFATQNGADRIWIIPSSVNELILILDHSSITSEQLNNMIQAVNRTSLEPELVLSAHSYIYDRQTDTISVA